MRAFLLSAVLAAGTLAAAAVPASAQVGVYVGPDGGGVAVGRPGYGPPPPPPRPRYDDYSDWRVSQQEAVRIARRNGMDEVYDVERTRHSWIVRGEDYRGRRVSMRVDRNGDWSW